MGLMKGIFIPDITVEMFRNGCIEAIDVLMAKGEIYDIEYDLKSAPCEDAVSRDAICKTLAMYGMTKMVREVQKLPSVHPERKKGNMKNCYYKRLSKKYGKDFKHHARSWANSKRMRTRRIRRMLKNNCGAEMEGQDGM